MTVPAGADRVHYYISAYGGTLPTNGGTSFSFSQEIPGPGGGLPTNDWDAIIDDAMELAAQAIIDHLVNMYGATIGDAGRYYVTTQGGDPWPAP